MLSINVGYPSESEELEIVRRTTVGALPEVEPVVTREQLLAMQGAVRKVLVSDQTLRQAVRLARATRPGPDAAGTTRSWVQWGAGPRASQYLVLGAKVWAALHGNETASLDDLRAVAPAVLGHRVLLNFQAEAEGISSSTVVDQLVDEVLS
jgi:MoxR-like ATPase